MFRKGDLVRHDLMPSWGIGSVKYAPRGGNLRIRFEQAGVKILHPGHAELSKVPENELLYMVIREVRFKRGREVETISLIPILKPMPLEVI